MNMLHTSLYLGTKVWRTDSYILQADLLCDVVIHVGLGSAGWWTDRMIATIINNNAKRNKVPPSIISMMIEINHLVEQILKNLPYSTQSQL